MMLKQELRICNVPRRRWDELFYAAKSAGTKPWTSESMTTIIDKGHDVDKYVPGGTVACVTCVHYEGGHKCKAFPDGIPQEILDGKNDHRKPYPGDHGIQYGEEFMY